MVVFDRIKGFIAGHWTSTNAKPQLLSYIGSANETQTRTQVQKTLFPRFRRILSPHILGQQTSPLESSKPPPPQLIRIRSFMEYNKTGWKNQNRKKSEYKKGNMKNKHRLFQCFNPATKDSSAKRLRPANGPTAPLFTYIAAREEGVVFPKILPPDMDDEEGSGCQKTKTANSRLSKILKAVFFGASLGAKRIGKTKLEKGRSRLGTSSNVARSKSVKEYRKNTQGFSDDEKRINSSVPASFRQSSSCTSACPSDSTSRTSSSRFLPETCKPSGPDSSGSKQRQDNAQAHGRTYIGEAGSCLLLVSLLVLIFCGKICAICYLSAWFYLFPRRTTCRSPEEGKGPPAICFKEYKKKVIMEGLLERNCPRRV